MSGFQEYTIFVKYYIIINTIYISYVTQAVPRSWLRLKLHQDKIITQNVQSK